MEVRRDFDYRQVKFAIKRMDVELKHRGMRFSPLERKFRTYQLVDGINESTQYVMVEEIITHFGVCLRLKTQRSLGFKTNKNSTKRKETRPTTTTKMPDEFFLCYWDNNGKHQDKLKELDEYDGEGEGEAMAMLSRAKFLYRDIWNNGGCNLLSRASRAEFFKVMGFRLEEYRKHNRRDKPDDCESDEEYEPESCDSSDDEYDVSADAIYNRTELRMDAIVVAAWEEMRRAAPSA